MDLIFRNLIFFPKLVSTYSNASYSHILQHQGSWASEEEGLVPLDFEHFSKKRLFSWFPVGKKQISTLLFPP